MPNVVEHFKEVESLYRHAIRLNPRRKDAYQFLCVFLQKQRKRRAAIKVCRSWAQKEKNLSQRDNVLKLVRRLEDGSEPSAKAKAGKPPKRAKVPKADANALVLSNIQMQELRSSGSIVADMSHLFGVTMSLIVAFGIIYY